MNCIFEGTNCSKKFVAIVCTHSYFVAINILVPCRPCGGAVSAWLESYTFVASHCANGKALVNTRQCADIVVGLTAFAQVFPLFLYYVITSAIQETHVTVDTYVSCSNGIQMLHMYICIMIS